MVDGFTWAVQGMWYNYKKIMLDEKSANKYDITNILIFLAIYVCKKSFSNCCTGAPQVAITDLNKKSSAMQMTIQTSKYHLMVQNN